MGKKGARLTLYFKPPLKKRTKKMSALVFGPRKCDRLKRVLSLPLKAQSKTQVHAYRPFCKEVRLVGLVGNMFIFSQSWRKNLVCFVSVGEKAHICSVPCSRQQVQANGAKTSQSKGQHECRRSLPLAHSFSSLSLRGACGMT